MNPSEDPQSTIHLCPPLGQRADAMLRALTFGGAAYRPDNTGCTASHLRAAMIYEIWGETAAGPGLTEGRVGTYGNFTSRSEAETKMAWWHQRNVVEHHYSKRFWIKEIDDSSLFQLPPKPTPRERYTQQWEEKPSKPGCWNVTDVVIRDVTRTSPGHEHQWRRCPTCPHPGQPCACSGVPCCETEEQEIRLSYHRDYPHKPPFEPFRQDGHDYALISTHYQQTDVMDLATGKIIATEDRKAQNWGFCPVGFYVPDWWDVHDGSILPGTEFWEDWDEWPDGATGFVWGCHWGDDNGWKVEHLDLSRIRDGIITRGDRYGYLHLDTQTGEPGDFIQVSPGQGARGPTVTFSVPRQYAITGELLDDGTSALWRKE